MLNEFYHTYNRGTDKRNIFLENIDYIRGVHDVYEFNDENAATSLNRRFKCVGCRTSDTSETKEIERKPRKILVDLACWTFMSNHYHFFSRPRVKDGLPKFHKKFGGGYTNFFNLKHDRNGVLFQGKYKRVRVADDAQAAHLVCYIHSNPLEIWKPHWKEKGLTSLELQNALKFLEQYRWSSHLDFLGIKNFPSLISTEFLHKFFEGPEGYKKFFIDWLKQYEKNAEFIRKIKID